MVRRSPGEGSPYQRKDGRWVAAVTVAPGQRITRYYTSRKAAVQGIAAIKAEYAAGRLVSGKEQTVRDFLRYWLDDVKRHQIASTSYVAYGTRLGHVVPRIGSMKLSQVTSADVTRCYSELLDEGMSAALVRHVHVVLAMAFGHAVETGLLLKSPCQQAVVPRAQRPERRALTPEEFRRLLVTARTMPHGVLFELLATTGLRIGEAVALRWEDVNLDAHLLQVRSTIRQERKATIEEDGRRTELVAGDPKTARSRRTVRLGEMLVATLREHQVAQRKARVSALVFPNEAGGYLAQQTVRQAFLRVLDAADLGHLRLHDLRHTAITLLLHHAHIPVAQVSEMVGHANARITLDMYAHVLPTMHADAANAMDSLIRGERRDDEPTGRNPQATG